MEKSENINELMAALCQFQGNIDPVSKNKKVKVKTKGGYEYEFPYADYEAITKAIKPLMLEHGLTYSQPISSEGVTTILAHSSGQYIMTTIHLNMNQKPQELGSEITYKRRYALSAILGLSTDEDDDGNWSSGNQIQKTQVKQKSDDDKPWYNDINFEADKEAMLNACTQGMSPQAIVKQLRQDYKVSREMADSIETILNGELN